MGMLASITEMEKGTLSQADFDTYRIVIQEIRTFQHEIRVDIPKDKDPNKVSHDIEEMFNSNWDYPGLLYLAHEVGGIRQIGTIEQLEGVKHFDVLKTEKYQAK